jgi:hypothetical protein
MISPWQDSTVDLFSPDGKGHARLHHPMEIGMGGPTAGRLTLSNGVQIFSCNPSMVWSDDSRYLAVPQWRPTNSRQRLLVVDMANRVLLTDSAEYRLLQLEDFVKGVIHGTDSPVFEPNVVHIAVEALQRTAFPHGAW